MGIENYFPLALRLQKRDNGVMKANQNQFKQNQNPDHCCWEGCEEAGQYPAPKSPNQLKERYTFCLNHIRQYNKSWNFFRGMNPDEIERFQNDSITGHRPTAKMGIHGKFSNTDELREQILREFKYGSEAKKPATRIPDNERDALALLGLKFPVTMREIKRKYKELAKKYHPDINGNTGEEKLKVINQAYSLLKSCGHFQN
jgi:hypothetical protein